MKGHILKNAIFYIFYFIISFIIIVKELENGDYIGLHHDWEFPHTNAELLNCCLHSFFIWGDANLGSFLVYPAKYILFYLLLPFAYLGVDGIIVLKGILLFAIALSGYSMYYLLSKSFKLNIFCSFLAGFFYETSPVMFNKIAAGHLFYLVAYALSPLVLFYFNEYIHSLRTRYLIISALLIALSATQLHFAPMLLILITVYGIFLAYFEKVRVFFVLYSIIAIYIIVFLIHFFWILPAMGEFSSTMNTINIGSTADSLKSWGSPFIDNFMLGGYRPDYYLISLDNSIYQNLTPFSSFILIILIYMSLLAYPRSILLCFGFLSIFALIFTAGLSGPFGPFVYQLYSRIALFNIFREIYHISFLISFSYSIMLGHSIHYVLGSFKRKQVQIFVIILTCSLIIINDPLIFSGDVGGFIVCV